MTSENLCFQSHSLEESFFISFFDPLVVYKYVVQTPDVEVFLTFFLKLIPPFMASVLKKYWYVFCFCDLMDSGMLTSRWSILWNVACEMKNNAYLSFARSRGPVYVY